MPTIRVADLHFGDIFLYNGQSLLSSLIRLFDGTAYSHASIYVGNGNVMESIENGINVRPVSVSVADANYVDVFRYYSTAGDALGSANLPDTPVQQRVAYYAAHNQGYAYSSLLLLAFLTQTRRIDIPLLGPVIRDILDSAAAFLDKLMEGGKTPVICSELVYRCFSEAGAQYTPIIVGADLAGAQALSVAQGLTPEGKRFLTKYQLAKLHDNPGGGAIRAIPAFATAQDVNNFAAQALAVPNFVTPGDLSRSPSLHKQGTLQA